MYSNLFCYPMAYAVYNNVLYRSNIYWTEFLCSLINALLYSSMILSGLPILGRFVVAPKWFHSLIMDLMFLWQMLTVTFLQNSSNLYYQCGDLVGLNSSVSQRFPLLSVIVDSWAFIHWDHVTITLNTGIHMCMHYSMVALVLFTFYFPI